MPKVLHALSALLALTAVAGTAKADRLAEEEFCLALAMYWEAKGEGRIGMLAVGSVVLNRVRHERFPDTVCAVVFQGGETPPCQFSWYCDGRSDRPQEPGPWAEARRLAGAMLADRPRDPTAGALFFHGRDASPPWRSEFVRTTRIGGHLFYR